MSPQTAPGGDKADCEIVDHEDCERCGGEGVVGYGRDEELCPDCCNIPGGMIPDDPPEDPHARIEEIREEKAQLEAEIEAREQYLSNLYDAMDSIREAADLDIVNQTQEAVLHNLADELKDQTHPYRRRHPERPEDFDVRVYELQHFIQILEDRQGYTNPNTPEDEGAEA